MPDVPGRAAQAPLVALVVGAAHGCLLGAGTDDVFPVEELAGRVAALTAATGPRWVLWSAGSTLRRLVADGVSVDRTWDLAEAHRLLHGGWRATPGHVYAACHGREERDVPAPMVGRLSGFDGDLFDTAGGDDASPLTPDGHLRADVLAWATTADRLRVLAGLALDCQQRQASSLGTVGGPVLGSRMLRTVWAESAAAVLCVELERDGLPVDRLAAEDLIGASAGPRPTDEADVARIRRERDALVLRHAPGRERTDLRNPVLVRELLTSVGVDVPNTRAWVLEPYRHTHPLVEALLAWRKDERIATTYGYRWLDEHVGADDRLRGAWTACDGAAGRMTAQNGLHNLPAPLRPAIRARDGHVFVRADLGQIEPRVLAVVSGDRAFAEATRSDDLYAPVAAKLGADRPTAKVAVLAAMYGQRSGTAGEALKDLERAYPVAMGLLDRTYALGVARAPVRTWGGRLIRLGSAPPGDAAADGPGADPGPFTQATDGSRGRFARNAIIQGAAAELFKAWAATVRHAVRPLGGRIVLCLHDELLVHVPADRSDEAVAAVDRALVVAARAWAGTDQVRFVADTSVVRRWSEAKA